MKCTTCGKTLSLRMTHCSGCGASVSFMTSAQPASSHAIPFAATPPTTPRLLDFAHYRDDAQPVQKAPNGPHYTQTLNNSSQARYYTYPSSQQVPPFGSIQAQQSMPLPLASLADNAKPPQATKKRHLGNLFLLLIVVCVLLLFGIGAYKLIKVANTPHIPKQADTPSGNALIGSASAVLKNAQTSSDIDSNLAPTQTTKTFMANQKIYMTFVINSGSQDGYIEAKWYADGLVVASTVLSHTHGNTRGVFSNVYITATPDGAVELYWCEQADCKDAQLAQVVHFVVTPVNSAQMHSRSYDIAQHFSKLHAFLLVQWQ